MPAPLSISVLKSRQNTVQTWRQLTNGRKTQHAVHGVVPLWGLLKCSLSWVLQVFRTLLEGSPAFFSKDIPSFCASMMWWTALSKVLSWVEIWWLGRPQYMIHIISHTHYEHLHSVCFFTQLGFSFNLSPVSISVLDQIKVKSTFSSESG